MINKTIVLQGLLLIAVAIALILVLPSMATLPEGFTTPVIAFEFARSFHDIAFLVGASEQAITYREQMRVGHQWNTLFPFVYAGFLLSLLWLVVDRSSRHAWVILFVGAAIVPFDLLENHSLMAILDTIESGKMNSSWFAQLHLLT